MKLKVFLVFALVTTAILPSCQYDDMGICEERYESSVTSVSGNNQGKTGQSIALNVKVRATNSCSTFERFKQEETENGMNHIPVLTYQTCGACPQNAPEINVSYQFKTGSPGSYTLRFKTGEGTFTEFVINITD